jgi:hypothetical protein
MTRGIPGCGARRAAAIALAGLLAAVTTLAPRLACAQAGWIESGDARLRADLALLNDAGIIRLPVTQWPMPRASLTYAMSMAKEHFASNAAVAAALARVRALVDPAGRAPRRAWQFEAGASAGEPGLLRDFDTVGREQSEFTARAGYESPWFAAGLRVTAAPSPEDDQRLRADGSHATVKLGNWLLSANTLERFWGPAHESSLILSNNARPMPTFVIERAAAKPFESSLLSWLGPWRFSFGVSRMESAREDIDGPLFLAWRVTVMPFKDIELGFTRTAQFCGEQLQCDLDVFGNLIAGNDNVGIDATEENEPGNQMAGFDIRWASPIGNLPYAVYAQYIGEDESSYLPAKYLAQLGFEVWKPLASGGFLQLFAEYASTTCSANSGRGPYYNCAYNQGRFDVEGYRYRGRVIGHTSDRDAENYSLGASFTAENGDFWSATLRNSRLNRDDAGDLRNTVASVPTTYRAVELGWRSTLFGGRIAADVGLESREAANAGSETEPFGFLSWRRDFAP